jgi:integrase
MNIKRKSTPKVKEPIKVRFKKLANGNQSIYLDYYTEGKREYEFLKLYLIPERTPIDKETNHQTLNLANAIKSKKIVELQNTVHGFKFSSLKQKMRLVDYLKAIAAEKKKEAGNAVRGQHQRFESVIKHILQYSGEQATFKQVTKEYCSGFINYLNTVENSVYGKGVSETFTSGLLSENTKCAYIRVLNVTFNRAIREGILAVNPFTLLPKQEHPKKQRYNREYLTIEEVRQLAKTPCMKPNIKNAFLFSCFSGLRFSDIKALTWGQLQTDNEGKMVIRYTQQKTNKPEYLQLSDEALKFLPENQDVKKDDIIFPLQRNARTNEILKGWICSAGITKRVTFHVSRHTNATLLLSYGVPIETVSKLLGHADIQTTQIYAKVIDKNKRDAVSKLEGLLD